MKTKKIFIATLLISISFSSFGQLEKKENNIGVSLVMNSIHGQVEIPLMTGPGGLAVDADGNILTGGYRRDNSLSFSVIPKYHFSDDVLFRFELGRTNLNLSSIVDSRYSSTHQISNTEVYSQMLRFVPGFQWFFMRNKKMESYCGTTVGYTNYRTFKIDSYVEYRDVVTDTIKYWVKSNSVTPGGHAVGIGAYVGFGIYLNKFLSFGAEMSSSAQYYQTGGQTAEESSSQVYPSPPSSTIVSHYSNSYTGFKISKIISSFSISIWF